MILKNEKPNYIYRVEVENWQRDLVSMGYSVKIDGLFGDETERATRQFQKNVNIRVDGIVGDETRTAMLNLKSSQTSNIYRRGSTGEVVRWIQEQYNKRGYGILVDGIFGPQTESATRRFQGEMGIAVDGIVGPITMAKLKEPLPVPSRKIKISIDNGHEPGNSNGGTQGYKEWEGNLKSARYLIERLAALNKFELMLTYDWNKNATVYERGNKAAQWGAQLLFSIHSNAGGDSGTECYRSIRIPGDNQYAQAIAEKISKEFSIPNRGAKTKESQNSKGRDFLGIIYSAQSGGVNHILLVESMFHDNIYEERLLLNDETHRKLAMIYAEVIENMF